MTGAEAAGSFEGGIAPREEIGSGIVAPPFGRHTVADSQPGTGRL